MKRKLSAFACLLFIQFAVKAQMKIGNNPTNINSASLLELESSNKGFVLPNVFLVNVDLSNPLPTQLLPGTVVFNTNDSIKGGSGIGPYSWSGSKWGPLFILSSPVINYWSLTGNAGINVSTDFLGTTDSNHLIIKTNGIERMRILGRDAPPSSHEGWVGLGTATPRSPMDISPGAANRSVISIQNRSNMGYSSVDMYDATGTHLVNSFGYANPGAPSFIADKDYFYFYGKDFLITDGATTNNYNLLLQGSTGYIGINTDDPRERFRVNGKFYLDSAFMPGGNAGTAGQVLTSTGIDTPPSWQTLSGSAWNLTGNSGTNYSTNFLGTTDNVSFRMRTNDIQRMLVDSMGSVAIGSEAFDTVNRERLLVDYGPTTSHTIARFKGNINSYLQVDVQNTSPGNNVTSKLTARAADGTDSTFIIQMGINSIPYITSPQNWGNAHDAYLYSSSKNLLFGVKDVNADMAFLAGGGDIKTNTVFRMVGPSGNIVIGKGDASDAPVGNTIRGPSGSSGTNATGGDLTLNGGKGAGTGTGGNVIINGGGADATGIPGTVNINTGKNGATNINTGNSGSNIAIGGNGNNIILPKYSTVGGLYYTSLNSGQISTTGANMTWDSINNRLGIGMANPPNKLSVVSTADPLYLGGVLATSSFGTDSVLTIFNGVVKKAPYSSIINSISATAPLTYNNGVLSIPQASSTTDGYLSSTNWNTFNKKVDKITLNAPFYNSLNFTVTGGNATGTLTLINQNANTVFAGPATGAAAPPTFRTLAAADLPVATTTSIGGISVGSGLSVTPSGVLSTINGGTVTSVGLSLPNIFTVSGSPVTTSGTLTGTLNSQSANFVFAGPTSGSAAPTFRALVASDLPSGSGSYIQNTTTQQVGANFNIGNNGIIGGTLSVIGASTLTGAVTSNAGITNTGILTSSGGIVNINASSNNATNINTGTSTGTVTIGNSANNVNLPKLTASSVVFTDASKNLTSSPAPSANTYLYYNGTNLVWQTAGTTAWSITGNGGINAATNFIGTTDAQPFIFRTNNTERMRMLSTGNIGIGTTNPLNALSIIASNPLYLSGLQTTTTYDADSLLVINAGVVKKAPTGSGAWSTLGNAGTSSGTNFLGTTDQQGLTFRVNNIQAGFLGLAGSSYATSYGVGSSAVFGSTAIGAGAQATGANYSVALGYQALAQNHNSIAIGTNDTASANEGISIGLNARVDAFRGVAIGPSAKVSNSTQNIAIGYNSNASSFNGIAIGSGAAATTSNNTVAIGFGATANGLTSMAVGNSASATGQNSTAFGLNAQASALGANAFGNSANASGTNTVVVGNSAVASAPNSIAFGDNTVSSDNDAIAIGYKAQAIEADASAIGVNANASGTNSTVLGNNSTASGLGATVIGDNSTASGESALVFGDNSSATGLRSTIIGNGLTTAANDVLILGNAAKKIGIGTTTPAYKLTVIPQSGNDPLYLNGVQSLTTPVNTDSILAIRGGVVKQIKISDLGSASGWSLTGNSGTKPNTNFIGTTDTAALVIRTGNPSTEKMRILGTANGSSQAGWIGIGTSTPRSRMDITASFSQKNVITIQNTANDGYSSVDMIASNGTTNPVGTFGYANPGTSSQNSNIADRDYFLFYGKDFIMSTSASGGNSNPDFFIEGDNGNIGINTSTPSQKLHVAGNIQFSGALMPGGSAGTAGQVLTSTGTGAPTWSSPGGNFILNQTTQQPSSTFNISGYGTIGDSLFTNGINNKQKGITNKGVFITTNGDVTINNTNTAHDTKINTGSNTGTVVIGNTGNNILFPKFPTVGSVFFTAATNGQIGATADAGTVGQVLTSNGFGNIPTWQTPSGGGGSWSTSGNSISLSNFLGSTNDIALTFKVNNNTAGFIGSTNSGGQQTSLGYLANASSQFATAIGAGAIGSSGSAVAVGYTAQATGQNSIAMGVNSLGSSTSSIAIGNTAKAQGQDGIAIGSGTSTANVTNVVAIGRGITASQSNSIILGNTTDNISVGIGTVTPNTNTKLDVSGPVKLGTNGTPITAVINAAGATAIVPSSISGLSMGIATVTVTNALQNSPVIVSPRTFPGNPFVIAYARVTSANTVTIGIYNTSGAAISANATFTVDVVVINP